jgi:valyl-tRNA synthetase
MELTKNFEPTAIDAKWYQHCLDKGYFNSTPNEREAYTVVIPPPNVTGVLHMGHCLNNTIQDILVRRARMEGKNACWVPGTDHASIATEAKVVQMLRERGITKSSLSREEFLSYAWEWKEKYGGIILQQLKKLGCSLDWSRTSFTMDEDYYKAVIKVFIDLYGKGLIYRGKRMVNWDPVSQTALSDEEVIFKDVDSKLYYVTYKFVNADNSDEGITVATTRPETILGDVAICVNPADERYTAFVGKEVIVPIINRKIPVIADEYVTADFGTGALKVTPAHDKNDNMLGLKHQLKSIDTLDATGKFTTAELMDDNPSDLVVSYNGVDRFALRKKIVEDISALGQIEKIEDYKGQIGTSERTGAVIESRLSMQWFIDMQKFMAKNPEALASVMNDTIQFHPAKLKNTYSHWLSNIKDWCISRQLWWGQQIPAWYDEEGNYVVAATEEEAKEQWRIKNPKSEIANLKLKQDEDVLDTWFSSWLWPMEVFKGISNPGNKEIDYYYPTTTLVTGQDIIFFWVARMIMAGYEYKKELPFKDVYFTGMVRDKQGRKMSKQLGNSPDLLGLIDQYGADATRFGIMIASPAGNDLLFDESSLEQGRHFNNKLWNALKLVKMWEGRQLAVGNKQLADGNFAVTWFENRLNEVKAEVDGLIKQFKLSEALKTIYSLIWDDFCSWYLEWVKPGFEQPIEAEVYKKTIEFFTELMQLLHPYMPFVTEEIYHLLEERNDDLCVKQLGNLKPTTNEVTLIEGNLLKVIFNKIRNFRINNNIKNSYLLNIIIRAEYDEELSIQKFRKILEEKLCIKTFLSEDYDLIPGKKYPIDIVGDTTEIIIDYEVNNSLTKDNLLKDLVHQKGFLLSVEKKLSNEKFTANAKPEVLALEQKKKADALSRIKAIEESLAGL